MTKSDWIPISERLPDLDKYSHGEVWKRKVLITGYLSFDDKKVLFVSEEFARQLDSSRYLFLPLWPEIKYESRLIWKNDNHDQEQLKAFADFVRVFFKRN
jgi:hypothetical protein